MTIAEKLNLIAENEQKVYEAGKKSQHDRFWDAYQSNGNRTDYKYAFHNAYWNDKTFQPKYKMHLVNAYYMFADSNIIDFDLTEYIDFSNCTDVNGAFSRAKFKALPVLNFVKVSASGSSGELFASTSNLQIIDKIIINADGSFPFTNNTFKSSKALKEIRFEGVIGTHFYISNSPLSKDSIINIFSVLSTTKTRSASFSKNAVNTAFETSSGANNGSSSSEWEELVATRPNWTISLI